MGRECECKRIVVLHDDADWSIVACRRCMYHRAAVGDGLPPELAPTTTRIDRVGQWIGERKIVATNMRLFPSADPCDVCGSYGRLRVGEFGHSVVAVRIAGQAETEWLCGECYLALLSWWHGRRGFILLPVCKLIDWHRADLHPRVGAFQWCEDLRHAADEAAQLANMIVRSPIGKALRVVLLDFARSVDRFRAGQIELNQMMAALTVMNRALAAAMRNESHPRWSAVERLHRSTLVALGGPTHNRP